MRQLLKVRTMNLVETLKAKSTGNVTAILRRMGLTIWNNKLLNEMTDEEISAVLINWLCYARGRISPIPIRIRIREDQKVYELWLMKQGRMIKLQKIEEMGKMEGCKLYIWTKNMRFLGLNRRSIYHALEAADNYNGDARIKKELY